MKVLPFGFALLLLISCGNSVSTVETTEADKEQSTQSSRKPFYLSKNYDELIGFEVVADTNKRIKNVIRDIEKHVNKHRWEKIISLCENGKSDEKTDPEQIDQLVCEIFGLSHSENSIPKDASLKEYQRLGNIDKISVQVFDPQVSNSDQFHFYGIVTQTNGIVKRCHVLLKRVDGNYYLVKS